MSVPTPAGVDWMVHRVASSRRYSDGLITIQEEWSIDDLLDAHEVLDMYRQLEELAAPDDEG